MEQQTNYIVFQCYGNEGVFHECAYALLSLSRLYGGGGPANTQICIYTDNPAWFSIFRNAGLSISFRTIDNEVLHRWRGNIDFVHRVKIEVLREFAASKNGNILYSDTDVVFTRPIEPMMAAINAGELYMHVMEGIVSSKSNPLLTKLDTYLRDNTPMKVNGRALWDLAMWNAGVLGFRSQDRDLLEDVLTFTDAEYPRFSKHIVEQFAFSVFFRQAGPIKTASPYIMHYWNLKEVRPLLASFFSFFKTKNWEDLTGYSNLIQMPVLMQEKVNFLHNRDITDKLLKKNWQPADCDWKDLMTQL
jgi:lipopolysaccharide biosynthesis glycosyltransferase